MTRVRILIFFLVIGIAAVAFGDARPGVAPRARPAGGKWRVAYLEGGPYSDYQSIFRGTVEALREMGWIRRGPLPPPDDPEDNRDLWRWLAREDRSDFIRFLENAYWSAGWDEDLRKANREAALTKLKAGGEIDLIIAMGTWAGQDLANGEHVVPTVVASASDPVAAGIIESPEDSGRDHVTARVAPLRFQRQVTMFHKIFGFRRLGVAYEDTLAGRSYAALDHVRRVADREGFEIVPCHYLSDVPDEDRRVETLLACHRRFVKTADAVYVTSGGVPASRFPEVLAPLLEARLPTFSQTGAEEVRYGCLMSMAQTDFLVLGRFYAGTMARIFNGAKPRSLPQMLAKPFRLALNLETAKRIGWDPPFDVLKLADDIFHSIPSDEP